MADSYRPYTPDTRPDPRSGIVFLDELKAAQLKRRKFNVKEFYRMVPACILGEDTLEELIDGDVMVRALKTGRHSNAISRLFQQMLSVTPTLYPSVQCPIRLDDYNEPVADMALMADDGAREEHPGSGDVLLAIEIADTPGEAEYDRNIKLPLYARYGIRELWLFMLQSSIVEAYRNPIDDRYEEAVQFGRGDALTIQALPEVRFVLDELLG